MKASFAIASALVLAIGIQARPDERTRGHSVRGGDDTSSSFSGNSDQSLDHMGPYKGESFLDEAIASGGAYDFQLFDAHQNYEDEEADFFDYYDDEEVDEFNRISKYLPQEDENGGGMTAKEEQALRYLQQGTPDFEPLSCNENITQANCTTIRLSQKVMDSISAGQVSELVIPCGECWYWDYDVNSFIPPIAGNGGINIIGKLHVPSTAHGMLKFPHVVVQGELQIDPPALGNEVKLQMFSKQDTGTGEWLDVFFHPHPENAHVCDATNGCKIGKKSITVAGGKLEVRGLEQSAGCPSWVKLKAIIDVERTTIVVGSDAASCWNIGDEIVLSSPLMDDSYRTVATIVNTDEVDGRLTLAEALPEYYTAATCAVDPDFCVEVASLTRRVVFDALPDDDPTNDYKHGGHLWVLKTPNVAQTLEGVEFRNFGQQGNLGRYPIHFHMCYSVAGSLVAKNVIRNSNQRCVVIHGSHDVHVYDNVAFVTHGHCYFTEDGAETGNVFERNLGVSTLKPQYLISGENDNFPSTFWITNTQNHWIENVAAGGESIGFWFDTLPKVRGPSYPGNEDVEPVYLELYTFRDNVAHSYGDACIDLYPPGYKPAVEAVFENSKVYRCKNDGWLVHGNRNMLIVGGIVADNRKGLNMFRSADVRFENMTIIGYSEAYERVRAIQTETHLCKNNGAVNWIVGTYLHSWRNSPELGTESGATFKDVEFRRFGPETGCTNSITAAIELSTNQVQTFHDCPNRLEGITFDSGSKKIDGCRASDYPIDNFSVEDVDGSVGPTGNPGFFVSDHLDMMAFAQGSGGCAAVQGSCLMFCEGACLRQVTFKVSNAISIGDLEMVIDDGTTSVASPWKQFDADKDENTRRRRDVDGKFGATVRAGSYDISFRNSTTLDPSWPSYVFVEHEAAPLCGDFEPVINLVKPPQTTARCSELVSGGDFEDGTFDSWQQYKSILSLTTDWTTAASNSVYALRVDGRGGHGQGASQNLDASCLVGGFTYEFSADIRLEDKDNAGVEEFCDPSKNDCPEAVLTFFSWNTALKKATTSRVTVGTVTSAEQVDSWYKISGSHTLTAQEASAERVELTFERPRFVNHIIDNVSLRTNNAFTTPSPTPEPTTSSPTAQPTTKSPTEAPTKSPATEAPTKSPATEAPTKSPTTEAPTKSPTTEAPTKSPTTEAPTKSPTTEAPTKSPTTEAPTKSPTVAPTTGISTEAPNTDAPTKSPVAAPPATYNEFVATDDVSIRSNKGGNTYGNKLLLQVMDETYIRHLLLKFDLGQSIAPGAASSVDAKLRLYVVSMANDPMKSIEVRHVSDAPSWDESSVTWNSYHGNEPALVRTGANQLNVVLADAGTVVEVDISDIVGPKVAEGGGTLVLQLVTVFDTSTNSNKVEFRSTEGAPSNPGQPAPTLVVSTGGGVAGNRKLLR